VDAGLGGDPCGRLSWHLLKQSLKTFTLHPIVHLHITRQLVHQLHRLHTHRYNLANQPHDVLLVVQVVGVADDAAAFILTDLVLIDDSFEGRAVAQAIGETLRRYPCQREGWVDHQRGAVGREAHLLHAIGERNIGIFDFLQGVFAGLLLVQVQLHQLFANPRRTGTPQRDARGGYAAGRA
jgi:hypothetical protein